ncbi:hypothetical protein ST47_g1414 [Ascochyta rabiei]|uniref:Uncharacterized protein n=1 Tax=Didymella rabiei TaxID=5454 RepID=A0A163L2B3_DIDRA|nr:hypothetical protein ST47_g1414 [Ascochyta rabiei]
MATDSNYMRNISRHKWILAADEVLSTVPPTVLDALCARSGNHTQLYETTASVKDVLDRYQKRGENQASIYVRELTVGLKFEPLTLELAEELAEHTRL